MSKYSQELQKKLIEKMMPPNSQTVQQISQESSIPYGTLYAWKTKYQQKGISVPADSSNPDKWSGKNKLAVVIEAASLNSAELSEYCRKKGLYPEQISRWKDGAISGNENSSKLTKANKKELQQLKKRNHKIEKELTRKEKALAEAAALLILQKKAQVIWGGVEEE
jgi:transposase-like protein